MEKFTHGGQIHRFSNKERLLDFSANINPLGLSKKVEEAIREHLGEIVHYPEPYSETLRGVISAHYGVDEKSILVSNGAVESLYLLAQVKRPKNALITGPTFSEYEKSLNTLDCEIETLLLKEEDEFSLPVEDLYLGSPLESGDGDGCFFEPPPFWDKEIAYFCNPNNPVGKLVTTGEWEKILKEAEGYGTFLVIDESFLDFLPNGGAEYSALPLLKTGTKNLLVLRSLTKFFAYPGIRLGFCAAHPDIVSEMQRKCDCWNVNRLAQIAGVAGFLDKEYQDKTRKMLPIWQESMKGMLRNCNFITFVEPTVNFILCKLQNSNVTSTQLAEATAERGLLIRDASNFSGLDSRWFRLAIRTEEENTKAIDILKEAWGSLGEQEESK